MIFKNVILANLWLSLAKNDFFVLMTWKEKRGSCKSLGKEWWSLVRQDIFQSTFYLFKRISFGTAMCALQGGGEQSNLDVLLKCVSKAAWKGCTLEEEHTAQRGKAPLILWGGCGNWGRRGPFQHPFILTASCCPWKHQIRVFVLLSLPHKPRRWE